MISGPRLVMALLITLAPILNTLINLIMGEQSFGRALYTVIAALLGLLVFILLVRIASKKSGELSGSTFSLIAGFSIFLFAWATNNADLILNGSLFQGSVELDEIRIRSQQSITVTVFVQIFAYVILAFFRPKQKAR